MFYAPSSQDVPRGDHLAADLACVEALHRHLELALALAFSEHRIQQRVRRELAGIMQGYDVLAPRERDELGRIELRVREHEYLVTVSLRQVPEESRVEAVEAVLEPALKRHAVQHDAAR